jgi:hypothetical protein
MDSFDDSPQLGRVEVDRDALDGAGASLAAVAEELGVSVDAASAEGAPAEGWRVLRRHPSGSVLVGAPGDTERSAWRVAQAQPGAAGTALRVHPDVLKLRPSRAERRRGLAVSWPSVIGAGGGPYAVDVTNLGEAPWIPDGDSFHAVGAFSEPGQADFTVGWATTGQESAVPLGPGDYARVPVRINLGTWTRLEPGSYDLHAVLVDLGLRTPEPLRVTLTAETIAAQRGKARGPQSSG